MQGKIILEVFLAKSADVGGSGGEAPNYSQAGGLGGAVSPPTGSRGGAPGSHRFLEHLEVFGEVLEGKMSEFLRSKDVKIK